MIGTERHTPYASTMLAMVGLYAAVLVAVIVGELQVPDAHRCDHATTFCFTPGAGITLMLIFASPFLAGILVLVILLAIPIAYAVRAVSLAGDPDSAGGDPMRRTALGALFFGWLYAVPFLLIVGLIRRISTSRFATHAEAARYGTVTDRLLTAALVINVALPVVGMILARLLSDRLWLRTFGGSLVGVALIFIVVVGVAQQATAPRIGTAPGDPAPEPRVTHCIPISGGHGCPGG